MPSGLAVMTMGTSPLAASPGVMRIVNCEGASGRLCAGCSGGVRPSGDPTSALIPLLEGDERTRMPPDAPLPQADTDLVRRWIEEGAPP